MTLELLPDFLADLLELQALAAAQDGALEEATDTVRTAPDEMFIESLSDAGAQRWETMLGLSSGDGNELAQRRFRLMTYVTPQTPFTLRRLSSLLENLCGEDNFSVALGTDGVSLVVRVGLVSKDNFPPVKALLERVVPANLALDVSLQYNTYAFLSEATHEELAEFTYTILKEEVKDSWLTTQQT